MLLIPHVLPLWVAETQYTILYEKYEGCLRVWYLFTELLHQRKTSMLFFFTKVLVTVEG